MLPDALPLVKTHLADRFLEIFTPWEVEVLFYPAVLFIFQLNKKSSNTYIKNIKRYPGRMIQAIGNGVLNGYKTVY